VDHASDFRVAVDVDAGAADAAKRLGQHAGSIFVECDCEIRVEMRHRILLRSCGWYHAVSDRAVRLQADLPLAAKIFTEEWMTQNRRAAASRPNRTSAPVAERIAARVTEWVGSSKGMTAAVAVIVVWAAVGPVFGWSDTWQLAINTGTTIVTFLMVFLIQRTQNKDGMAIQLKLNELVASMQGCSNRLIEIEDLSEEDLHILKEHYRRLVEMAREDVDIAASHSIEEAESRHAAKRHT
jgi:low affinity Fe/Cu permease